MPHAILRLATSTAWVRAPFGFEIQRNFAAGAGEQGDSVFALAQGAKLLGVANLEGIGARREQGAGNLARIQGLFDFLRPGRATGDALGVESGVEAFAGEGRLKTPGQFRPFLRGGRDEGIGILGPLACGALYRSRRTAAAVHR